MKKVYKIKNLFSSVTEDSYKDGEVCDSGFWSGPDILGKKIYSDFDSILNILRMLNEDYLNMRKDVDNIENWAIFEDDSLSNEIRLDCDILVDTENFPAGDNEIEKWKRGQMKLYNVHSVLHVAAEYVTYSPKDELTSEAQSLGLETI